MMLKDSLSQRQCAGLLVPKRCANGQTREATFFVCDVTEIH